MEIAQSAKSKGNKYFKAGKFQQAINCYTTALENCPVENAADIATFYQNRAAAYEHLVYFPFVLFLFIVFSLWLKQKFLFPDNISNVKFK